MSSNEAHPQVSRLVAWLDGELSTEEAAALQRHGENCVTCAELWRELSQVKQQLADVVPAPALRPIWPAVRERLERDRRPLWRPAFTATAAAAALVGVLLGLYLGSVERRASVPEASYLWAYISSNLTEDGGGSWPNAITTAAEEGR